MEDRMKTKLIGYWATTSLLALALISGGLAQMARLPENVEGIVHLGYPVYFMVLLGFWKVLGGFALLAPRLPRLKEWAYAGVFFEMTGASVSHLACSDSVAHAVVPLVFTAMTIASWRLRPESRAYVPALRVGSYATAR
jgi:uncharacterized membrane protein YphA (DoxX/SURF4 family)